MVASSCWRSKQYTCVHTYIKTYLPAYLLTNVGALTAVAKMTTNPFVAEVTQVAQGTLESYVVEHSTLHRRCDLKLQSLHAVTQRT